MSLNLENIKIFSYQSCAFGATHAASGSRSGATSGGRSGTGWVGDSVRDTALSIMVFI